jgi:hypothetical protein
MRACRRLFYEFQMYFSLSHLCSHTIKHPTMSPSSFPIQFSHNCAGMPYNGTYSMPSVSHSPSLSTDFSFLASTFGSGPTTPLDSSLLSLAQISYPFASGGLGSIDSSTYMQLLHQNQLLEHKLLKERQEHASLKYIPFILTSYCNSC